MNMALRELTVLALAASLGGCDVVWGLSGEPSACELRSFEETEELDMITGADSFTISGDSDRVVVEIAGELYERRLSGGDLVMLPIGQQQSFSFAIAPEGRLLFYALPGEPPKLLAAVRGDDGVWSRADRAAPKGVAAGVPSAEAFGPRRVLVRTRYGGSEIQEYEDDGETWQPIGPPRSGFGVRAPNLTENGLTMVFVDKELTSNQDAVFAASRNSTSDWFGEPRLLRMSPGATSAQLIGKKTCDTLFTSEQDALRRYEQ